MRNAPRAWHWLTKGPLTAIRVGKKMRQALAKAPRQQPRRIVDLRHAHEVAPGQLPPSRVSSSSRSGQRARSAGSSDHSAAPVSRQPCCRSRSAARQRREAPMADLAEGAGGREGTPVDGVGQADAPAPMQQQRAAGELLGLMRTARARSSASRLRQISTGPAIGASTAATSRPRMRGQREAISHCPRCRSSRPESETTVPAWLMPAGMAASSCRASSAITAAIASIVGLACRS